MILLYEAPIKHATNILLLHKISINFNFSFIAFASFVLNLTIVTKKCLWYANSNEFKRCTHGIKNNNCTIVWLTKEFYNLHQLKYALCSQQHEKYIV